MDSAFFHCEHTIPGKKVISLISGVFETGAGVILAAPSGVCYSNQVGGMACLHPVYEGVFIPMLNVDLPHDANPQGDCGCWGNKITEAYKDKVDRLFEAHSLPLAVDRTRDGTECWIPIVVVPPKKWFAEQQVDWEQFVGTPGIYTTADNCD